MSTFKEKRSEHGIFKIMCFYISLLKPSGALDTLI